MKVAIIGSRSVTDYSVVLKAIEESSFEVTEVVSGGAKGVDTLAEKYAGESGLPTKVFLPDYTKHGKVAPHVRNSEILSYADKVIAIWDGKSRGTGSVIEKARKKGLDVWITKV